MDGLTETRTEIARMAGLNARLMWRNSVSNVVLAVGMAACAAWAIHAENKSAEVRTVALMFDQNLTLLAKADVSRPFVPTDDFYIREATNFILDFRARPRTKEDYLRTLNTKVLPFALDSRIKKSLEKLADQQTSVVAPTNVLVSELSVFRDGDRPEKNTVNIKASWTETSATIGRVRKWEALLTIRYIPAATTAAVGDPGYGMKLADVQLTNINT